MFSINFFLSFTFYVYIIISFEKVSSNVLLDLLIYFVYGIMDDDDDDDEGVSIGRMFIFFISYFKINFLFNDVLMSIP